MVSAIKKNHIKQEDFEKNLHILFPLFVNGFGETLDNFDQVKKLNYIKFLIGGHKAGSAIFSFSMDEDDLVGLLVWTLVGSNQYWFEYVSDKESFDQKLPLAEKVLQSIKIPPATTFLIPYCKTTYLRTCFSFQPINIHFLFYIDLLVLFLNEWNMSLNVMERRKRYQLNFNLAS